MTDTSAAQLQFYKDGSASEPGRTALSRPAPSHATSRLTQRRLPLRRSHQTSGHRRRMLTSARSISPSSVVTCLWKGLAKQQPLGSSLATLSRCDPIQAISSVIRATLTASEIDSQLLRARCFVIVDGLRRASTPVLLKTTVRLYDVAPRHPPSVHFVLYRPLASSPQQLSAFSFSERSNSRPTLSFWCPSVDAGDGCCDTSGDQAVPDGGARLAQKSISHRITQSYVH